ncbi:MAG: hypothetical protein BWK76_12385 [Desulfobulbaceae bacterium A2]|nr:MAG: hypothetical protein BWK76_12385 [Desulfobulbaceae bacterium A2]
MHTRRTDSTPYRTKDGSLIRELLHPAVHGGPGRLSLAEATVLRGGHTEPHRHRSSEEMYHVLRGTGTMLLDGRTLTLGVGDTVRIPPGSIHALHCDANEDLVVLCCCTPPYSHDDTELQGEG